MKTYTKDEFDDLCEIILRVTGNRCDAKRLLRDLDGLLLATGNDKKCSQRSLLWKEFSEEDLKPSEKAKLFNQVSKADNPLDPEVCVPDIRPEFNAKIGNRWSARWKREGREQKPTLRELTWDGLSNSEKSEVRKMAHECKRLADPLLPL
ncbi:hypothetical protein [Cribrihabitans marinus]|nr:hypothetical protein [Cribrihabitans marinus]